jgi:hypothetical protein
MKDRHIIVTNAFTEDIKDFKEKREYLKVFHKMQLNDIDIELISRH